MSWRNIHRDRDFKSICKLFEFFIQIRMKVRTPSKRWTFTKREIFPAIHAGTFGESNINYDCKVRIQVKSRSRRTSQRFLFLRSGNGPNIPKMQLGLKFFKTNRKCRNGGTVIERMSTDDFTGKLSRRCVERNEIAHSDQTRYL